MTDNIPHSTANIWNNGSFANVLKGHIHKPQIYTKEGEEDMLDDLGLTDILQEQDIIEEGELCFYVEIPWENYKQSWKKWRRNIILKSIG